MDKWLTTCSNRDTIQKENAEVHSVIETPAEVGLFEANSSLSESDTEDSNADVLGERACGEQVEIKIAPGPKDLSSVPTDHPTQPYRRCYPGHDIGGKERRFNATWFKLHNWLEYSLSTDAAYCFTCRHFAVESQNQKNAFISTGFRSWNRATGKDPKSNAFLLHKNSDVHILSVSKHEAFKSMNKADQTVVKN